MIDSIIATISRLIPGEDTYESAMVVHICCGVLDIILLPPFPNNATIIKVEMYMWWWFHTVDAGPATFK